MASYERDQLSGSKRLAALLVRQAIDASPNLSPAIIPARALAGLIGGISEKEEREEAKAAALAPVRYAELLAGTDMAPRPQIEPSISIPAREPLLPMPQPELPRATEAPAQPVLPPPPPIQPPVPETPGRSSLRGLTLPEQAPEAISGAIGANVPFPTPRGEAQAIRTVIGEAAGGPPREMQAVSDVIQNRALLAGTTPSMEVLKPGQFEPWMTAAGRARMGAPRSDSPEYQRALEAYQAAKFGDAGPPGATHFYAPEAQRSLGRRPPRWDDGTGEMVGRQKFFELPYGGQQPPRPPADVPADAKLTMQMTSPADPLNQRLMQIMRDENQPANVRSMAANQLINRLGQKPAEERSQHVVIGKDERGNNVYGGFNPRTNRIEPIPGQVPYEGQPRLSFDDEQKLRKEAYSRDEFKKYREAVPILNSMVKSAPLDTPAADIDYVYGVAKIFDPESVVREGEMKIAVRGTGGLPDVVQGWLNQVIGGQRLTPAQRASILEVSKNRVGQYEGGAQQAYQEYQGLAGRIGARSENILPTLPPIDWEGLNRQLTINPRGPIQEREPVKSIIQDAKDRLFGQPKQIEDETRTIGNKTYIKRGGQWYER